MISLKNVKMKPKMVFLFLLVGLLPLIVMGIVSFRIAESGLVKKSYEQLLGVREIKRVQVERFFQERQGDMNVLVETVSALRAEAFLKLEAVRETKRAAAEGYFTFIEGQVRTFSQNGMITDAMREFATAYPSILAENNLEASQLSSMKNGLSAYYTDSFGAEYAKQNPGAAIELSTLLSGQSDTTVALQHYYIESNSEPLGSKHRLDRAGDASSYSKVHGTYHPRIRKYLEEFGYYDIFLADVATGTIVYSVFKEVDFGTSLLDGAFAETNLGDAFRQARDSDDPDAVFFVDYESYLPSFGAPAGFIASPIFEGERKTGVALFQIPINRLNAIMNERAGLGDTGETYLVGPDKLMRSDSYLDNEKHSVLASFRNPEEGLVDTDPVQRSLSGERGIAVTMDYNNNPVLSAFTQVKVGPYTWALLAEMDVAEAFSPKDSEGTYLYQKYKELYGYRDLFLFNPDGYCFYSVDKEADYQTNLVTGPYKDSGLGTLVREVLETKAFGVADFAPYAPSDGEPALFIAQPVVHEGSVETIVAFQVSLESINAIMQQREGMGETGKTYLVGSDYRMRSDIKGDPIYNVNESFKNDRLVKTTATESSFQNIPGSALIIDAHNVEVLSAYAPVHVGPMTWALLAEIHKDEVYQPMATLFWTILLCAVLIAGFVMIVAYAIAVSIVKPVLANVSLAEQVAGGDLTASVAIDQRDEIGTLANALNGMSVNLRAIMTGVSQCSTALSNSSTTLGTTAGDMGEKSEAMSELTASVAAATEEASANLQSVATAIEQISANSDNVSAGSEEVSANLNTVGAAVEEMSANMQSIASAVEEMTSSVNAVATAAEEMSTSLSEVSQSTEGATQTAAAATSQARGTVETVHALGESANEIGKVVGLITGIAAQTNLLALNATIEAASAGEAGKGFAVVANEVKELARQTASATEEISAQVSTMQSTTHAVTDAMAGIVTIIEDMQTLFDSIAASVNEQSKAINEIARNTGDAAQGAEEVSRNVQEAAMGASEVSRNVQEASLGASEIVKHIAELSQGTAEVARNSNEAAAGMNEVAKNVARVNTFSQETRAGASKVNDEADGVSSLSAQLLEMVAKFKIN